MKKIALGITALALFAGGILSRTWAVSWPQTGYREWQTAFNPSETLLEPLPDLFWWSSDVDLNTLALQRGRAWAPVVLDIGQQGAADPILAVGRQNQLVFYRPNLPRGFTAGANAPQAGTVTFGGTNAGLDETGILTTNPVFAVSPALQGNAPNSPLPGPATVFVTHGLGVKAGSLTTDDPAYVQAIQISASDAGFTVTTLGKLRIRQPLTGGTPRETRITGMTFADIGTATDPLPFLFLTTADGQVVCVDTRPFAGTTATTDVDPAAAIRWRWINPGPRVTTPAGGGTPVQPPGPQFAPIQFNDGMNPAVGRVPLNGLPNLPSLPAGARTKNQTWQDQVRLRNREWLVFVADRRANAWAIEAFGETKEEATNPGQQNQTLTHKATTRWTAKIPGGTLFPDRLAIAPVFWNGNTPSVSATGDLNDPNNAADDLVVFPGVGSVAAFDAQGRFLTADQAVFWDTSQFPPGQPPSIPAGTTLSPVTRKLGEADGTTQKRWQFPETGANAPTDGRFPVTVVRGLAGWSGSRQFATTGANSGNEFANTNADDDRIFVRWNEKYVRPADHAAPAEPLVGDNYVERLGSLTAYGSIETNRPIDTAQAITVTFRKSAGTPATPTDFTIPTEYLSIVADWTDTSRTDATLRSHRGRITIIKPVGLDSQDNPGELSPGDQVTVQYTPTGGSGRRTETNLDYPSRVGRDVEPTVAGQQTPASGAVVPVSIGLNAVTIEEEATANQNTDEWVTRLATEHNYDPDPAQVTQYALLPGMSIANDNLYFGSRYRGRVYVIEAASLLLRGELFNTELENPTGGGAKPGPNDDIPAAIDPIGNAAIADGWLYVSYGNGYLASYANFDGGAGGTNVEPPVGPFGRQGSRRSAIPIPQIRLTDTNGNPITDEDRLRFDWGQPVTLTVTFSDTGADSLSLATNPVRLTIRGPMGDLPPVTVSPSRRTTNGNIAGVARIEVIIPNATPSNPMTPGTPLLKEVPDVTKRSGVAHWELRAEQIGTNWLREPDDTVGPWEPNREAATWNPARNTAPWFSINNPIALVYEPQNTSAASSVAMIARFAAHPERKLEAKNGDPYLGTLTPPNPTPDSKAPTVVTVGTDPATGHQLLFAEHAKASPAMTLGIVDRSDLGLRPSLGSLHVRIQLPKVTKLGTPLLAGNAFGSVDQNYPDDGADGYYSSIPGDRLNVVKQSDGANAAAGQVALRGVSTGSADLNAAPTVGADGFEKKVLQVERFNISLDVPVHQADGVYATRARLSDPTTASSGGTAVPSPATAVDPLTPYRDYAPDDLGADINNPPPTYGVNDRPARVTVFVDANNNGRLDLQGNYREAFRTFAVQVAVRPDMRLEAAAVAPRTGQPSRVLDLGKLWHGFQTPTWSRLRNLDAAGRTFFEQYWKPFVLLNTGNTNLIGVKPEVALSAQGRFVGPVRLLSDGVDFLDSMTLMRDPTRGGNTADANQIYLRTSFDDQLQLEQGNYDAGGVWLQKARPGSTSPGTGLYGGNPADGPNVPVVEPKLTLNIPMGTPLGTYAGDVRFFNDRKVSIVADDGAPLGFRYQVEPGGANRFLDRLLDPNSGQLAALEPFADPALTVKVRVTEDVAAGSTGDPNLRGRLGVGGGTLARTSPGAGVDLSTGRLFLFYSSNQIGLTGSPAQPLRFDIFGNALPFDDTLGTHPFDSLPLEGQIWGTQVPVSNQTVPNGVVVKNTKPAFAQDPRPGVAANARAGYVFWHEEQQFAPGQTRSRLLYRRVTPSLGEVQVLAPGGAAAEPGAVRQAPRAAAVAVADGLRWFVFWNGSDQAKGNVLFSQSPDPEDPTKWSTEAVVPTSPSLATVTDASPSYMPTTKTLWLFYNGVSQKIGRSDMYATKLDPSAIGTKQTVEEPGSDRARRSLYGLLGFAPRLGEILRANATRTTFTSGGVDWRVNATNPASIFINGYVPLPATGDASRPGSSVNGLQVYISGQPVPNLQYRGLAANDEQNWSFPWPLRDGGQATVYVTIDGASGTVRFSQPPGKLQLPGGSTSPENSFPDPQVAADYIPGSLRLTTSDKGATGGVGFMTATYEPSWYWNTLDNRLPPAQRQNKTGAPFAARADRLWAVWRRPASGTTLSPTLYYKTFRPALQIVRPLRGTPAANGNFYTFDIQAINPPDLGQPGAGTPPPAPILQDVDIQDGVLYFRQEDENRKVIVRVKDINGNVVTQETHYIGWREESTETPVPMDVAVNEGTVTAFPMLDGQPSQWPLFADPSNPSAAAQRLPHLAKVWLFWTSTRGTGSDIFHATIAPRLTPVPG